MSMKEGLNASTPEVNVFASGMRKGALELVLKGKPVYRKPFRKGQNLTDTKLSVSIRYKG